MEEAGTTDNARSQQTQISPLLRTIVSDGMARSEYENQYWPQLEGAIKQLLQQRPGVFLRISYEQMYSCVYKCVCQQYSERMYNDLKEVVTIFLQQTSVELQNASSDQLLCRFHEGIKQYSQALGGIVPIFNYLNRFYVTQKLGTDLRRELTKLFVEYILEPHLVTVLSLLQEAQGKPFSVHPTVAAEIIHNLHEYNQDYAQLNPPLFAKYIPNVLPPTRLEDLPLYIAETQRLQEELLAHQGYNRDYQRMKRTNDDVLIR
ncbi:CDK2-associated and cullin domain-containing protein 1-like [Amphiura filiformis]|uniref:CDK2-associated and cullin domain-containing protein 1-like n=1 Tax=Amphiura filiformis TaxID=82378 RepID=UPI003B223ADF